MALNTLVPIGFLGQMSVYLNVSVEEAQRRYKADNDYGPSDRIEQDEVESLTHKTIVFDDEFEVYDIGPAVNSKD